MNKDIRRKRTENYFIDAMCDIIRQDGMGAATIRNVADRAGYNSATIYTYFNSLAHLLLKAHMAFELELLEKIKADIGDNENVCEAWITAYISMAGYYLHNPNIFECVFVSTYQDAIPDEMRTMHGDQSGFMLFVSEFLQNVSTITGVDMQVIGQIHQACISLTVGTVLLHVKERFSLPHEAVLDGLAGQVRYLIEGQIAQKGGDRDGH